jgi:hypothetical protein
MLIDRVRLNIFVVISKGFDEMHLLSARVELNNKDYFL